MCEKFKQVIRNILRENNVKLGNPSANIQAWQKRSTCKHLSTAQEEVGTSQPLTAVSANIL